MKCHDLPDPNCLSCKDKEIELLKAKVTFWNHAWLEQREKTGKSYWMVPRFSYMVSGPWYIDEILELKRNAETYNHMMKLLSNLFGFLQLVKYQNIITTSFDCTNEDV